MANSLQLHSQAPLNAQGVQDELISQGQQTRARDSPKSIANKRTARNAPRLMTGDACAMITG